jgi:hypothetical protein
MNAAQSPAIHQDSMRPFAEKATRIPILDARSDAFALADDLLWPMAGS